MLIIKKRQHGASGLVWHIIKCLTKPSHSLYRLCRVGSPPRRPALRALAVLLSPGILLTAPSAGAATFECLIEPMQIVELSSPVTGVLDRVMVKRGDRVAKGQVVATLESKAEQAAADLARFKSEQTGPLAMAENKINFSKRKFDRRRHMAAEKLLAMQESDDAEAELRLAESELKLAEENRQLAHIEYRQQSALLSLRSLRSPFDGVVADQVANPGEVVDPGAANKKVILKMAQLDPLRIHVILPKEAFGKPVLGQAVEIVPEIPSQGRYTAKVKSIDKLIDAASGTFVVFLEMPNPKLDVPSGVKCRASFMGMEGLKTREPASAKR